MTKTLLFVGCILKLVMAGAPTTFKLVILSKFLSRKKMSKERKLLLTFIVTVIVTVIVIWIGIEVRDGLISHPVRPRFPVQARVPVLHCPDSTTVTTVNLADEDQSFSSKRRSMNDCFLFISLQVTSHERTMTGSPLVNELVGLETSKPTGSEVSKASSCPLTLGKPESDWMDIPCPPCPPSSSPSEPSESSSVSWLSSGSGSGLSPVSSESGAWSVVWAGFSRSCKSSKYSRILILPSRKRGQQW